MTTKILFLVGAGASYEWPASLPLFDELREAVVRDLAIPSELVTEASGLAPETFSYCLEQGGLQVSAWLTETLGDGQPNFVHHVLANAIATGATVWTTNVDQLVERAAVANIEVSSYPDLEPNPIARLIKVHGNTSTGEYIFSSDKVLKPLSGAWRGRLLADATEAELVVIGYAAADTDLRAVLAEVFDVAANITWFEFPGRPRDALRARFPILENKCKFLPRRGPNLSRAILRWARSRGLDRAIPEPLTRFEGRRSAPSIPSLKGRPELASALLSDLAGDRQRARAAFRHAIVRSNGLRYSVRSTRKIVALDLYDRRRWTRPLVALAASPLAPIVPRPLRRELDRIDITLLSSFEARHEAVLRRSKRVSDVSDPAILVAQAMAFRNVGDLATAEATAALALREAQERGAPSEAAHALNELILTRSWQGHLTSAREALTDMFEGFGSLASLLWIGWSWWHRGAIAVFENRPDEALMCFGRARECMSDRTALGGALNCDLASLAACRLAGDPQMFELIRLGLRRHESWFDEVPSLRHALLIEDAEQARAENKPSLARELNERVISDPAARSVQRLLGNLGLAELDREAKSDSGAWDRAWEEAEATGHGFIRGHLVITSALAGRISDAQAIRDLRTMGVELTPRRRPARKASDYCLGPEPSRHAVFMP